MSLPLGEKLSIRSMVYVASEQIPFFWPMRTFIHHNPLHGLEDLPFDQAVQEGKRLFHGRVFLRRPVYQDYLEQGKIDLKDLEIQVSEYISKRDEVPGIDLNKWLCKLLTDTEQKVIFKHDIASAENIQSAVNGEQISANDGFTSENLKALTS